jgi:hypothetical protein
MVLRDQGLTEPSKQIDENLMRYFLTQNGPAQRGMPRVCPEWRFDFRLFNQGPCFCRTNVIGIPV